MTDDTVSISTERIASLHRALDLDRGILERLRGGPAEPHLAETDEMDEGLDSVIASLRFIVGELAQLRAESEGAEDKP